MWKETMEKNEINIIFGQWNFSFGKLYFLFSLSFSVISEYVPRSKLFSQASTSLQYGPEKFEEQNNWEKEQTTKIT